ncbi:MAG: xanthine dehydrogenase family protein molybdopterin-binding subunit [Bradyrhizobium sp.]|uniref:xanthine dehydrogenase family protein molybdopterin-binding subunit n=1 Tax=Bradyrhizobium sp. TaxID=376 RepID=UPI001C288A6A|nr:molybdopterin cofactor-binding domain-containing protein [Bradyrhizobium sp.]MBU6464800.1 molybdopterin-dependent oxidoreductase [Pseudomonadota bacterium]MDE2069541.1 xanthine dehydrogenase family protein molybdopterin-binding subunit [Bradyrhizobium sp.]MDE2469524.1 xanthine dehydrogenase family protein molybdopterin-binding subunit [Bradyrhizobium sp.]
MSGASVKLSRRSFLEVLGGGIAVAFGAASAASTAAERPGYPDDFHSYLAIRADGRITVFSGKIEMGQGIVTSLAQMAAEELGADVGSIDMVMGDTDRCPFDMGTFGSLSTRMFGPALRAAAAKARTVLTTLAAERLNVSPKQLTVAHGVVSITGQPVRRVTFGELAERVRITETVTEAAVLRAASDFTVMGRPTKRLDGIEKVTGRAKYAGDIRLPDMLYARILRAPTHGAVLVSADTNAAEKVAGVTVVNRDGLIAVLHADPETAAAALRQIGADWRRPEAGPDQETIFEHLVAHAGEPTELVAKGDVSKAAAAKSFETIFQKGYVAHAPIEPHVALADVRTDRATVWASTQTPFPLRDSIAAVLGFDNKRVRVITPYVGGGFGGKSAGGQASEAARLSQICGRPVQVMRTREEEFFYDTFDPACVVKIASALGADGKISRWDYEVIAAGERGATPSYDLANVRVRSARGLAYAGSAWKDDLHPFAVGPWRAPGANMNIFATESQIDIMAAAAGTDPLAFRLGHLSDGRMRKVLQTAVDAFGWQAAVRPSGRGHGIAISSDAGSVVATIAEVKVDRTSGRVTVVRIVCAQDMGIVVNPEGARMQIEGAITMGLGYSFSEELRFQGGEILDKNYDTYRLPRFDVVPKIEAVLVSNDELAPQGCGEPAITTVGAVLANAVFDATGARMLRLPMTPQRVAAAIARL